ncbi:MAG: hypothetical protein M1817_002956 [Caeruleum heppii]|nr:MAG: hypothetical protein M1817_002956 [Caeruleum heppii]
MANTVHVKNISQQTSEKEVRDFFSFCGKITSISVTPSSSAADSVKSATVTFEKETAAKTALLLDNTQLGPSHVQVSGASGFDQMTGSTPTEDSGKDTGDLEQEDKPRSRIVAEYLAHGYSIGDQAIQRAIELDKKHGISNRFTAALANFDSKFKATDKAKSMDASYGLTDKANAGWRGLHSYFEKALGTPSGQKVIGIYTQSEKQVMDIHAEARRLANLRKGEAAGLKEVPGSTKTTCNCGGDETKCACEPGKCACSNCPKSSNSMNVRPVAGSEKTVCNCGGDSGKCPCEPGKCGCDGCEHSANPASGSRSATGPTDSVAAASHMAPLGSNVPGEAVGSGGEIAQDSGVAPVGGNIGGKQ